MADFQVSFFAMGEKRIVAEIETMVQRANYDVIYIIPGIDMRDVSSRITPDLNELISTMMLEPYQGQKSYIMW